MEYDLIAFLVARYFSMASYTATYGVLYVFFSIGAGVGPLVFGWCFDQTHSYSLVLELAFAALLGGGAALLTLGRYRFVRGDSDDFLAASTSVADAADSLPLTGRV